MWSQNAPHDAHRRRVGRRAPTPTITTDRRLARPCGEQKFGSLRACPMLCDVWTLARNARKLAFHPWARGRTAVVGSLCDAPIGSSTSSPGRCDEPAWLVARRQPGRARRRWAGHERRCVVNAGHERRERKAKAASDAAAVAEKQASAAESFARVCQLLIREDLDAAAAAYQAAIASDAASTSSWAHGLSFYLRKYRLESSLVQAMFPGVEGVEVDAGGSSSGGLGSLGSTSRAVSKRPFDGTVEELKASATAKRAEADAAHSRWHAASSRAASSAGSNPARAVPSRNARPAAVASTAVATRRVTKELRQLARAEHGWTVELPDEANCYVWRCSPSRARTSRASSSTTPAGRMSTELERRPMRDAPVPCCGGNWKATQIIAVSDRGERGGRL